MPTRPARSLAAACLLLAPVAALSAPPATTAPAPREVVDKSGKIAFAVDPVWQPLPKTMAALPSVLLAMRYTGGKRGGVVPVLNVMLEPAGTTLDQLARASVAGAKRRVPDQGDAGTITPGTLDGEPSLVVVTRTLITAKPAERKAVFVAHGGTTYLIEIFCGDDQFQAFGPVADGVLAGVRWK